MGEAVYKKEFTEKDFQDFGLRLHQQLEQLREFIKQPQFQQRESSFGAELEMYLVDDDYNPAAINEELLARSAHPQLTPELNQYNLEFNLSPVAAAGAPFAAMENELRGILEQLQGHAREIDCNIIPIGILPTLQQAHLNQSYMTDRARYHALNRGLCGISNKRHTININGPEPLTLHGEGVTMEGANTSFQVHLRVPAESFARNHNAAQISTPMVVAMAANSPMIAGHRLWQETRIALFKQSIDFRERKHPDWRLPARVSFGQGWVRDGAWELFAENVALFPPLIPILFEASEQEPMRLPELGLHHGTVWPWNRAVYDHHGGGHLRIEFRALPAGPTIVDMMANAALSIGLTVGLAGKVDELIARLPFKFAEYNFYRAAQYGLDAQLIWPKRLGGGFEERPITELIEEWLPLAETGLASLGVDTRDSAPLWRVVQHRLETRRTGANWQLRQFAHYRQEHAVNKACSLMLADYARNVMDGAPVANW
jgi:gamma-glutamyl:cysteine ligase YbdK (ATP-grasp superfamily)